MRYKNILWIEDMDDKNTEEGGEGEDWLENESKDSSNEDLKFISSYFPEEYETVKLIKDYSDALEELEKDNNNYDLIIFDINLKEGIQDKKFEKVCKILAQKRVFVKESKNMTDFIKRAGLYLYLYLLNIGYPMDRMIFLTGNYGDTVKKFLRDAHVEPDNMSEEGEKKLIFEKKANSDGSKSDIRLSVFYQDDYYQIRRLVFSACDYWERELEKFSSKKELPFNKIYYREKEEASIEKEAFISMLRRVRMLFPVAKPQHSEELYYQSLQVVTGFHEEGAKIHLLNKEENQRKYHQAIRFFRNWASHIRFQKDKIAAKLFMYIFIVSLRTYFAEKEQFSTKEKLYYYEKELFDELLEERIDRKKFEDSYVNAVKRHIDKLQRHDNEKKGNKGKNKNSIPTLFSCDSINDILLESGHIEKKEEKDAMFFSDLFLSIMDELIEKQKDIPPCKVNEDSLTCTVQYSWKSEMKDSNLETILNNKENYFTFLAYRLFLKYYEEELGSTVI